MTSDNRLRDSKIFYGWYVVLALAIVNMVTVGMGDINFGLFLPHMIKELGISQASFGWAVSARTIGYACTGWYLGIILDRYGARVPLAVAGLLIALILLGVSHLHFGWQLVALYFAMGAIGIEGGGGNLYQSVPLSRWFIRKRGRAMSMIVVGSTVGMFIFSPFAQMCIDAVGWRSAWIILGCVGGVTIFTVAISLLRKDPQSMGLEPDGASAGGDHVDALAEYSWTRSEAVRSFQFWSLSLVHGFRMFGVSAFLLFRIPFFIERGFSPKLVAWALSMEAVTGLMAALAVGRIAERVPQRFIMAGGLCGFLLSIIIALNATSPWHVILVTVLNGLAAASYNVALNALWPTYFGSKNIGSIRGVSQMVTVFSIVGAPICGLIKDATGSYTPAWIVAIVLGCISVGLIVSTGKPKPRLASEFG